MTDKSTPGPWVVDEDHKGMGEVRVYESAWKSPAPSPRLVAVFGNAENDHERKAADARLGAAAPELYEALSHALRHLPTPTVELSGTESEVGSALELLRVRVAAGEALAKARGEK